MKKIFVIIVMALVCAINMNAEVHATVSNVEYTGIIGEQIQLKVTVTFYGNLTEDDLGTWQAIVRPVTSGIQNLLNQQSKSCTKDVVKSNNKIQINGGNTATVTFTCSAQDSSVKQCKANSFTAEAIKLY